MTLEEIKKKTRELKVRRDALVEQVSREKAELEHVRQKAEDLTAGQKIAQSVASGIQQQVHKRIAEVVTKCLVAVFGDQAYEFRVEFEEKRGKTEARLVFDKNGLLLNPLDASGGGMVDVAAFALRVAALVLCKPSRRRVLVLDEPFRFVGQRDQPSVRRMLETISEDYGIQIIMSTHISSLCTGKIIELG